MAITKKQAVSIKRDLRNTLKSIDICIAEKDWNFLDQMALQLSASALQFHSESEYEG